MTSNALLTRIDDSTLKPTQQAVGPWDANLLFGGVPAGLAVHEVERQVGASDWQAARITTDLVRPAPRSPLTVDVDIVRQGSRAVVATASILAGPKLVSRSSLLLIPRQVADQPNDYGTVDRPTDHDVTTILTPHRSIFEVLEIRAGDIRSDGERGWARLNATVVEGEPASDLARAAVVADLAAGMTNTRGGIVEFINADVSLFLERVPSSDWLRLDLERPDLASGIAVASASLGDEVGPAGQAVMTSVRAAQAVAVGAAS
jgi:hypothetical protein